MRHVAAFVLLALFVLLPGCCCGPEPELSELARIAAGDRTYVALRLTPLEAADDGGEQVLIESLVVSAPRGAVMPTSFDTSTEASAAAILAEVPGSEILQKPSIVTRVTETATIEVSYEEGGDVSLDSLSITVHPGSADGPRSIEVTYLRTSNGEPIRSIPARMVAVPAGKTILLEARRP